MTASHYAKAQYQLVKGSREVLIEYCKTVTPNHFIAQNTSFGRGGSMSNLLVHIVNTYQYWIEMIALGRKLDFNTYESKKDINEVIRLFEAVDTSMLEFFEFMDERTTPIKFEINGKRSTATAFELFTHVITHEYHHKGQVLSLSRHLGYVPVDTDIMR